MAKIIAPTIKKPILMLFFFDGLLKQIIKLSLASEQNKAPLHVFQEDLMILNKACK